MSKKNKEKRTVAGQPPRYESVKVLEDAIDHYLANPPTKQIRVGESLLDMPLLTITGLALHLGFCSRQSFYDYEKHEQFSYTIKRARTFIEQEYEQMLAFNNVTGAIFALKNMGWKDKTEVESNITMGIKEITDMSDEELQQELDSDE